MDTMLQVDGLWPVDWSKPWKADGMNLDANIQKYLNGKDGIPYGEMLPHYDPASKY